MSKIIINFDLSLITNLGFHKEKLDFAQKMLDYYNSRSNLNISLEYTSDKFEFICLNYNTDDFNCTYFVNYATSWYIQERNLDKDWLSNMIDKKQNVADNIKSTFQSTINFNVLTQSDVDFFIFQRDRFKALYKDFNCFTFLSAENRKILKTALNSICSELDKVL